MEDLLKFYIDASLFRSRRQAHGVMQQVFEGYEYYGNNLDALFDVLTSIRTDAEITVHALSQSEEYIEGYAERIRRVFLDAAEENPHLTLVFSEDTSEEAPEDTAEF